MADTVQYLMEKMIPELEDFERKGYFSRGEVKIIVQKRQNFEYLLKRRTALKEDYYRYIEFETKLEELRKVRKAKLGIKGKKTVADVAIVRRIHFIFERAGRKFRSDINLWMRWIETCKRYQSNKQLSKVITKALQRHCTVSQLWIEAAQWEFDTNNDISAARSLMQQGIRMCKTDEDIWVQYYQLELLYALKLRVRRQVLGLTDPTATDTDGKESAAAVRAVMEGGIARIVFKNAVVAIPGRLAFRARFLRVLRGFEYGFVAGLVDQVFDSIRQDFGKAEEAWDLLARRHIDFPAQRRAGATEEAEAEAAERQLEQHEAATGKAAGALGQPEEGEQAAAAGAWDADTHQRVCSTYEEGLQASPSQRMYELYTGYLCGALEGLMGLGEAGLQSAVSVAAQLFGLLQRTHGGGMSSPATYITWVDWAETVQQPKMAVKAARKGCERFPADVSMWRRRLQLELSVRTDTQETLTTIQAALLATPPQDACEIWLMATEVLPATSPDFERLVEMLAAACAKVAKKVPTGGLGSVAAAMVEKARAGFGLDAARQLYAKLLSVPGTPGDLYRCAIRLEREAWQQLQGTDAAGKSLKTAAKRITDLYEAAVTAYGCTEGDLWIDYATWLQLSGKGAGQLYWRATKELADPDDFIEQYRKAIAQ